MKNETFFAYDAEAALFRMVVGRLLDPKSKLGTHRWASTVFWDDGEEVDLQHYYRCRGFLSRCMPRIEKNLFFLGKEAYQIKLTLQRLWNYTDRGDAELFLKKWYFWPTHSRLEPLIEAAKTIKRHWQGILRFVDSRITTGIVEGLNSKIKTAMKRAYGFKSFEYLRPVIYLVAGKINIPLPTQS